MSLVTLAPVLIVVARDAVLPLAVFASLFLPGGSI